MKELNAPQTAVYNFLKERLSSGIPPSVREICKATGIKSTSSVHNYLKDLESYNYITRDAGCNRSIRIPNTGCLYIPLLNKLNNELSVSKSEIIDTYIPFSSNFKKDDDLICIKAPDNNLNYFGIFKNDILIIKKNTKVKNNDIAVSWSNENILIRNYIFEDNVVKMFSDDNYYQEFKQDTFKMLGKVVSIVRYYN